jgi:hypothetical protein
VELAGRCRPDLVGETTAGGWIALECKGRILRPSADAKQKAKEQAERITTVDGVAPLVNAGCITFFKRNVLQFFWRDPTPDPARIKHPIVIDVPGGELAVLLRADPRRSLTRRWPRGPKDAAGS